MLSDAPNASWHPALMPNSISDLPPLPTEHLAAVPTEHGNAQGQPTSLPDEDAVEEIHNQSVADAWFPDYGSGDGWIGDAGNAPASAEISGQPDANAANITNTTDATANHVQDLTGAASKHLSTMSFTRTVPHEVSWNDDDDPEWNLERTGTDPFRFMPPSDRTNSFPSVPPVDHPAEKEIEHPLSPSQAEDVLHRVEQEESHESLGGFSADPEAFGASFDEEDIEASNYFQQTVGGDLSGTAEEAMEARFEEGVPLIPSATDGEAEQDADKATRDLFGEEETTEEDDFFNQALGNETTQSEPLPPPLERKSTTQVLDSLAVGQAEANFSPWEETVEEEVDYMAETTHQNDSHAEPPQAVEPNGATTEDLDAKWKAMFGDEEEDGFLPDDATETKEIDPAGFLGSDDEGFLEDSDLPPPTEPSAPSAFPEASTTEVKPVNGRYLPPNQTPNSVVPSANPYLPTAPSLAVSAASPFLPAASASVLQPPAVSPYVATSSAPPVSSRYGFAAPPPAQEQNKPQSFVDKAKGGYTSPYDLPMEVVKPKLRASTRDLQRSTSTPNAPFPCPPAPPRSTSMNSPLSPTTGGFGSNPSPPSSSHTMQPPPSTQKPPAPNAKPHGFFEELPIAAKPRPASRHSTKSVPSPPQTSPYAPPPHAGPPMLSHVALPQAPPTSQPMPDIPRLIAPPRVSPYAPLQPSAGLGAGMPTGPPTRYSPAPPVAPLGNGPVPATTAPPSRYSPAPPARQASAGYMPAASASAPPTLPHQPRTSSPLAQFGITHERSRPQAPNHHTESGLSEKRSTGSTYEARVQRVPSLPPTTEVEEEESSLPVQTPTGYMPTPPSTSPESRYGQVPHRSRQTPPPPAFYGQATLSPPKRAMSSHGAVAPSHDFAPPQRSQTQSPGKLHGNRNGKPTEPIPRPSSVHDSTPPHVAAYPGVAIPPIATATTPPSVNSSRTRGFSHNLNLVAPTDGREKDPLQRWRGVPLISWGVGGTVVTMFPKDVPRYGINQSVPMVVRSPGEVKIQSAKDIQPLEERLTKFPGPLKGKSKKKETIAWLATGIESLERSQPNHLFAQLHLSHDDKRAAERILLWKILQLFIEHDGTLEGNPVVEKAVRDILSPNLKTTGVAPIYITGADTGRLNELPPSRMQSDAIDSSTVEQIRRHLLDGDSAKAIWAAADVRLWGHALLLANALAPDLYRQVAQEFIKKEVNSPGHNNESLAALYGVLSGNHEESVDELVPVHARAGLQLLAKDAASGPSRDAMEGLDKWRETLSLILSNRSSGDGRAINSLGTLLSGYGRAEAAHICFMFARNQTVFGGLDDPNSNFVLVGSDHKRQAEQFAKEIEPLLLSEVYEYGQSLAGGSNVAVTNPHLAAYKLQHAYALAEYGYRDKALQYCEAIYTAITAQTKRSPYHHIILEAAVEDLMKRLRQAPKEESNSWIPKPSMNKVSDSVWNRFNKFVAGDENDTSGQGSPKDGEASGPFARVAGGTPTLSRPPSTNNLETFGAAVPSYGMPVPPPNGLVATSSPPTTRAGSRYAPGATQPAVHGTNAYEPNSAYAPRSSMERTSSELTRNSSDLHRQSSESQRGYHNPYAPGRPPSPPHNYTPYGAGPGVAQEAPVSLPQRVQTPPQVPATVLGYGPPTYSPAAINGTASAPVSSSEVADAISGYQPPSYGYEPPSFTPYETPAEKENGVSETGVETSSYEPPSYQPYSYEAPSYEPESQPSNEDDNSSEDSKPKPKKKGIMYDEDDDMPKPAVKSTDKSKEEKDRENAELFRKAAEEDAKRAAEAKQGKKGWGFGGWFGGGAKKEAPEPGNPNKPIRAKLGEANSFYYDPEQKRWVNKNADPKENEVKKAAPPPPRSMSRSISASPAPHMGPTSHPDAGRASAPPAGPPRSTMTPPPPSGLASSASATNLAGQPSLGPPAMMRSVSNMSNTSTGSAPSRPTTSLSNSSSLDDLLGAAGPRKGGAKKPRKSARYVDVMTKD